MMKWWALFFISGKFYCHTEANRVFIALLPYLLFSVYGYFTIKREFRLKPGPALKGGFGPAPRFILISATSLIVLFTSQAHMVHDMEERQLLKPSVRSLNHTENIAGPSGGTGIGWFHSRASETRDYCIERLAGRPLTREASSLLRSLILGDRRNLGTRLKEDYRYIGISHFLALSGLHLGLIVVPVSFIAGFLPFGRRPREALLAVFIVIYTAIA